MAASIQSKILIGLRVLFILAFLAAGGMKLAGNEQMVTEFGQIGLGQWFRYVTGGIEVIGALLLIRARTASLGAALLTCVSVGAFGAQLLFLHGDLIHTIVFAVPLAWIAYAYRDQLLRPSGRAISASAG